MGWSDLPSDLVISVAARLVVEHGDYVRFRTVCKSWDSALRGFRPALFPWLAVFPPYSDEEFSFISHAGNDCSYVRPMPWGDAINSGEEFSFMSNCKDGWMIAVRRYVGNDFSVPLIFNPLTGAQLQPLPSLRPFFNRRFIDYVVFLPDKNVAFISERWYEYEEEGYGYPILAAATPGAEEWSVIRLSDSPSFLKSNLVFHEADHKFYAMHRGGNMTSFRLTRFGNKIVFGEVSYINTEATTKEDKLFDSHLVSDGINLLRVRKEITTMEFDMFKYCPDDADRWVKVINMDLGNNSLFLDRYEATMIPLPLSLPLEEGRPRKNCIYFTGFELIEGGYINYVRIYDVGKGTVEPCFPVNTFLSYLPTIMWFKPSL